MNFLRGRAVVCQHENLTCKEGNWSTINIHDFIFCLPYLNLSECLTLVCVLYVGERNIPLASEGVAEEHVCYGLEH